MRGKHIFYRRAIRLQDGVAAAVATDPQMREEWESRHDIRQNVNPDITRKILLELGERGTCTEAPDLSIQQRWA